MPKNQENPKILPILIQTIIATHLTKPAFLYSSVGRKRHYQVLSSIQFHFMWATHYCVLVVCIDSIGFK
jgi:hypothetical protein